MSQSLPQLNSAPSSHNAAAMLFNQLFLTGIHMTAETVIDVARWTELTEKLASYVETS